MGLQSVVHWGVDLTLAAMLLAAVRRNTGLVFAYEKYGFTQVVYGYLSWGEYWYKRFVKYVRGSPSFRKQLKQYDGFVDDIEDVFDQR